MVPHRPRTNIRIVALSLDISPLAFKLRFVVLPFWFWWYATKDLVALDRRTRELVQLSPSAP